MAPSRRLWGRLRRETCVSDTDILVCGFGIGAAAPAGMPVSRRGGDTDILVCGFGRAAPAGMPVSRRGGGTDILVCGFGAAAPAGMPVSRGCFMVWRLPVADVDLAG